MGMSTTDCSEGILNPWTTTDAKRQCDTVQSVGTGDPLTMYMAVAVVLLGTVKLVLPPLLLP